MNAQVLNAYHRLPAELQSLTATLRGLYLRAWRYGPQTRRAMEQAMEREHWSAAEWDRYRTARLAYILNRAATRVPFYQAQWAERRRQGDDRSPGVLEHWPILEKDTLRAHARSFVADDSSPRRMFHEHTSGTTGKPLDLWRSRQTLRAWYALSEARWRGWHGVSAADRWAILGGQLVAPVSQRRPPFWVWNSALKQLYMSCYHLSPEHIPAYLDALEKFEIRYLWGYSSALYTLAQEAVRTGRTSTRMVVAIANAEQVFDFQRTMISRAFGCPLRQTYGLAEKTVAAGECEAGRLHLWPEVGIVEVVDGDRPAAPGSCGELVCTSLLDADMPLVRYRVGDRGAVDPHTSCGCGRTLPLLKSIDGRTDDVVITPDGRRVGRLDPVFKADLHIREAQIIQDALDHVLVLYVPDAGFSAESGREIVVRLQDRLGDVRVTLQPVDAIPRGANGKFRAVMSRLSKDEMANGTANTNG
jgi:phenylacetate-CoA ligase